MGNTKDKRKANPKLEKCLGLNTETDQTPATLNYTVSVNRML